MKEPQFTPGPWRWWTSNSWRRLTSEATDRQRRDGGVLCPTTSRSDGHPDCIIKQEDMDLIAAAPELYGALEAFRLKPAEIVGAQAGNFILRVPTDVIARAAAALAKARGEAR